MDLLCFPSSSTLRPRHYSLTTKSTVSSTPSSLQYLSRDEFDKSSLPSFSLSPCQPQLSSPRTSTTAARASGKPTPYPLCETVEHIVLLKMKQPGTNLDILIHQLNNLKNLPGVIYLTSGLVADFYCSSSALYFDVFVHSRHRSKQDLDMYMNHPAKLKFTHTYTERYHEDYMILDWVVYHPAPLPNPAFGAALRLTCFDLNGHGWGDVYDVIGDEFGQGAVDQITFGQNYIGKTYRPAYKEFLLSSLAVFSGAYEMKALGTTEEFGTKLEQRLTPIVGEVMVVDYIIQYTEQDKGYFEYGALDRWKSQPVNYPRVNRCRDDSFNSFYEDDKVNDDSSKTSGLNKKVRTIEFDKHTKKRKRLKVTISGDLPMTIEGDVDGICEFIKKLNM